MTCSSFVSLVADYVAGDLPDAAECEIAGHVRECTACAAALERERSVRSMLADWSEPEDVDEDRDRLRAQVRTAIEIEFRRARRRAFMARLAAAASIAIVAVLLAIAGIGRIGSPVGSPAIAGPATRVEDTEPSLFTMVGPFSKKDGLDSKKRSDKPRRVDQKSRRVGRRSVEPSRATRTPKLGVGAIDSDSMMRFEFQTQDPKIRIIWFVPRAEEGLSTPGEIGD